MPKKKKNVDRISLLPDCLLHDIFSSLNTQQVVQTCVLSKRWKTLWTCIPTLNFDFNSYSYGSSSKVSLKESSFKHFILRVLSRHCGSNIKKMSYVSWSSFAQDAAHFLELSVCYAGCHKVEELCINTSDYGHFDWNFSLSACHSLTVLKLTSGYSSNWGDMKLPSLKILEIRILNVSGECENENMFSGCPNLESLVIANFICEFINTNSICAPKLASLELSADKDTLILTHPEIELLTPNLRYVKFDNVLPNLKSALDFSCVEEVNIVLYARDYSFCYEREEITKNLVQLLRMFHNPKSITMPSAVIVLLLSVPTSVSECFSFHNLRHLKLESMKSCKNIKVPIIKLQRLLKCPSLETMVVDIKDG